MSGLTEDNKRSKSPLADWFGIGLGDGSDEDTSEDESGKVEFGESVAAKATTAAQIAADMKAKTIAKPQAKTVVPFEKGTPNQTETLVAKKVAPAVAKKVEGGGEGKQQEGGVMHWLGLAGGRKRRRKKSRKKKKKSKSKKRRRRSRKAGTMFGKNGTTGEGGDCKRKLRGSECKSGLICQDGKCVDKKTAKIFYRTGKAAETFDKYRPRGPSLKNLSWMSGSPAGGRKSRRRSRRGGVYNSCTSKTGKYYCPCPSKKGRFGMSTVNKDCKSLRKEWGAKSVGQFYNKWWVGKLAGNETLKNKTAEALKKNNTQFKNMTIDQVRDVLNTRESFIKFFEVSEAQADADFERRKKAEAKLERLKNSTPIGVIANAGQEYYNTGSVLGNDKSKSGGRRRKSRRKKRRKSKKRKSRRRKKSRRRRR